MNISFNKTGDKLLLEYAPDNGCEWIADIFSANKPIIIKRAFTFTKDDVEDLNSDNDETRTFVIGL